MRLNHKFLPGDFIAIDSGNHVFGSSYFKAIRCWSTDDSINGKAYDIPRRTTGIVLACLTCKDTEFTNVIIMTNLCICLRVSVYNLRKLYKSPHGWEYEC